MRREIALVVGGVVAVAAAVALFFLLCRVFLGIVVWLLVAMFVVAAG
ncbi:MAG: hypothetical protein Q4A01_01610 [Coriobacteriales bacterium]|nr:hypothetical protein [Coriobacteriales bacterium]